MSSGQSHTGWSDGESPDAESSDAESDGSTSFGLRSAALFGAGVVSISGHVGLGLGLLGPLAVLPTLALGVAVLCFFLLVPSPNGGGRGLLYLFAALLIVSPGFWLMGDHMYAQDKFSGMLTVLLPVLVVVTFCAREPSDMDYFWRGLYLLALFGVLVGFFEVISGIDIGQRGSDSAGSLNPIAAGRLGGSVILATAFSRRSSTPLLVRAGIVLAGAGVLLGAASRGPLLALIVAVGLTTLADKRLRGKMALAAGAVVIALSAGVGSVVLAESGDRILDSNTEAGSGSRSELWGIAIDGIAVWPEGVGWGQFSAQGDIGAPGDYPHNFFLELALEAGVLASFAAMVTTFFVLRRLWHSAEDVGPHHFALLVFWMITAQFSSDMNGNRVFIIALMGLFTAFRFSAADRGRHDVDAGPGRSGQEETGTVVRDIEAGSGAPVAPHVLTTGSAALVMPTYSDYSSQPPSGSAGLSRGL